MEQLKPEVGSVLAEQRLVGFEADVAPAVEIEGREAVGQRRNRAVEGRGGEIARPLHDVLVAERRRRRRAAGGASVWAAAGAAKRAPEAAATLTSSARRDRSCMGVIQAGRSGSTRHELGPRRQAG